jgi:hypothetical protein
MHLTKLPNGIGGVGGVQPPAGPSSMQGLLNRSPSRTLVKTPNKKQNVSHSLEPRNTSVVVSSLISGTQNTMP